MTIRYGYSGGRPMATGGRWLAALWLFMPTLAAAQDGNVGAWITLAARGPIGPATGLVVDGNVRLSDDRGGVGQTVARLWIEQRLSNSVSVDGGYSRFANYDHGRVTQTENRLYQHLVWRVGAALGGRWTARTRLEQRFVTHSGDVGLRLRQRIAYSRPISRVVTVNAATESFFALNSTDYGAHRGFDTQRSTLSLAFPLVGPVAAEIGYMNQYQVRRGRPDVDLHALTTVVTYRF